MSRRNNPYLFVVALVLGVMLAVGGSVWATSVGTNVSVTGNLTVSSTSASSSVTYALGVGTSTPARMFSVGGAGGTNTGHGYFTGGLGVGNVSTTTAGGIETSGAALLGGVLNVTGAATLNSTAVITTSLGIATTSPATTLSVVGSTYTTLGLGAGIATTTSGALQTSGPAQVGTVLNVGGAARFNSTATFGSGTAVNSIMHGFCLFGPIVASQSIAATSTGTVACTTEAPTGLAAGDKVWLTASTTSSGTVSPFGSVTYIGIASSTATDRIQATVYNGTGAAWTVTTSTWQYLIVK